ncbi:hypothetical protein BZG36_04161 [Bifiguratus adelaidae]|uniref:DUF155 domain-containing protein n=1 Tax=Bifiguratus adelaidae TaxID=1938954 RepID=A0A261XWA6_9FUNG|nr:hypothetical protein BZG36_04161 [Bifiguratus adelaidae]
MAPRGPRRSLTESDTPPLKTQMDHATGTISGQTSRLPASNVVGQPQQKDPASGRNPYTTTVLKNVPTPTTTGTSNKSAAAAAAAARLKTAQPVRSTKLSQKLVLLPEDAVDRTLEAADNLRELDETLPPIGYMLPESLAVSSSRTDAERFKKEDREAAGLPRVTAYCVGEGYKVKGIQKFLRASQGVAPRLYDECLYAPYHFPLSIIKSRQGISSGAAIVKSAPLATTPDGTSLLEKQLERFEELNMDYEEDNYFSNAMTNDPSDLQEELPPLMQARSHEDHSSINEEHTTEDIEPNGPPRLSTSAPVSPTKPTASKAETSILRPFTGGEVFVFDYGVVVFWNFTRAQELLLLEDFAPYCERPLKDSPYDEDVQIEEMHFQYDTSQAITQPRIFNDMITLKSGNHMIKLTISHAISQSAVLARFEDMMEATIEDTKHIPKQLAQTGRLSMNRTEITKINGHLFKLRMNVNLVSNVLDTPEIFWSEPALQPLYNAMKGYLEISQRAKILNDRCEVISDLLLMLREHMNNAFVSYQTWIIIWMIVVAVLVAMVEVGVKFLGVEG